MTHIFIWGTVLYKEGGREDDEDVCVCVRE